MAERLDMSSAYGASSGSANVVVTSLLLDWENAHIIARFRGDGGHRVAAEWVGAAATTLMVALNKANLTSNSLHRRVINQALTDGKLPAGTVSGSPD